MAALASGVAAVGLLGAAALVGGDSDGAEPRTAPAFVLPDLRHEGKTIELAALLGKPVVVNLFASWCEPCKRELPLLVDAAAREGDRVQFVGIAHVDDAAAAVALLDRYKVTYPAAADRDGVVGERYRLVGLPSTLFIDSEGELVGVVRGELRAGDLDRWLARFDSDATGSSGRSGPLSGATATPRPAGDAS